MKYNFSKALAIFCILTSININAQNINEFYFEANIARNLVNSGEINDAIASYETAFEKLNYVPIKYLEKVKKLAKQNKDVAREINYSERIEAQKKGSNPLLINAIDSLFKEDQKVRTNKSYKKTRYFHKCESIPNCNKHSKKYIEAKIVAEHFMKTDSLNTYFLLDLFDKHGFIGEELVGPRRADYVTIVLLHFDADTDNSILEPPLKKALEEGKIEPEIFAQILDRHFAGDMAKQIYWTWPDTNKNEYPITQSDIPGIIKLRESIGIYGLALKLENRRGYWIIKNTAN